MSNAPAGSILNSDDARRIRLLAGRAMNLLDRNPVWGDWRGKLDVFGILESTIGTLVRAGERDERALLDHALAAATRSTVPASAEATSPV